MSEGPEVHRLAGKLHDEFAGSRIVSIESRLKKTRAWLEAHPGAVQGREIARVFAAGKNLLWLLEGDLYFHMHLLIYGKIKTYSPRHKVEYDRRARQAAPLRGLIVSTSRQAELINVQVFNIGLGDPFQQVPSLAQLGPDICATPFDRDLFVSRLRASGNLDQEVGPTLLDQSVAAGLGNYLKSDILFECGINPWTLVRDLNEDQVRCLADTIPVVAQRALRNGGQTLPDEIIQRIRDELGVAMPTWHQRHWVFRHTNRPCKICGTPIRQKRQGPGTGRITFYCPRCQRVAA